MEVIDAVNLIVGIHSKGNAIQTLATHHTRETIRMVRLARSTKDSLQDWL